MVRRSNRALLSDDPTPSLAGQHPDWTGIQPQPSQLMFGPYTPTDKAAILDQVTTGVPPRASARSRAAANWRDWIRSISCAAS
ncbi:hypothetical protein [Streptomyces sp. NPDC056938]|uniref:hypothetical protein n=1 Tax=unclassified Streptomyces TaxID=2593676 RepID=UPI003635AEBA